MPIIGHVQIASAPARAEPEAANSTTSWCSAGSMRWDTAAMSAAIAKPARGTVGGVGLVFRDLPARGGDGVEVDVAGAALARRGDKMRAGLRRCARRSHPAWA